MTPEPSATKTGSSAAKPVILFVTYTMIEPVVGGAFFRALRLAVKFAQRGWSPIICNNGPMLNDPKIDQAREIVKFVALDREAPGLTSQVACDIFKSFDPAVVVFGEGPFDTMKVFYKGAQMVGRPFVVLDQFYNNALLPDTKDVDLVLLYGLRSFWRGDLKLRPPYMLIPPFIEAVTPKADLPVPAHLHAHPWVTVIAYQPEILAKGIMLASHVKDAVIITVSHTPEQASRLFGEASIPPSQAITLPLQSDANIFGLMGASRVIIVSNGFLQVMEALAMASPVICINRSAGITSYNIDDRFKPYVSIDEDAQRQRRRLTGWLETSPFAPALRQALQSERGGLSRCATLIAELV